MIVTVGKIVRVHGVRGEVVVDVRTDMPEERFAPGSVLSVEASGRPTRAQPTPGTGATPSTLTVDRSRPHQRRLLVQFEGIADRTAAEKLRGLLLKAQVDDDSPPPDPEEYFDRQLVGLDAITVDGDPVGEVKEILHGPGQDVLVLTSPQGSEILVPFVAEIVPEVDTDGGRLVIAPPPGLLDLPGSGEAT